VPRKTLLAEGDHLQRTIDARDGAPAPDEVLRQRLTHAAAHVEDGRRPGQEALEPIEPCLLEEAATAVGVESERMVLVEANDAVGVRGHRKPARLARPHTAARPDGGGSVTAAQGD
jgi:hypothetical protein